MTDIDALKVEIQALEADVERVRAMWGRVNALLFQDVVDSHVLHLAVALRACCPRLSAHGAVERAWCVLYREPIDQTGTIDQRFRN